jgi:putative molybdopterin biosynthesis protein
MIPIQSIRSINQLRILADPRRLAILKHLMAGPASLTTLGKSLGEHPAWVRHHLKLLETAGLVYLVETRVQSGVVEKFYLSRASGYLVQELILPENTTKQVVVFSGSHDLAVELLARQLSTYIDVHTLPVGSLDGLVALRQNLCNLSGVHLLDSTGEYNLPFVRHFFPDRPMLVTTLAHREQGLMTAAGNPKGILSLADLARNDVTFINRNPGSGTRLWLDRQLRALTIPPESIHDYKNAVNTHTDCARRIKENQADVALGLRAAAHQHGLDFVPLFHERYDIVFAREQSTLLAPLLDTIQTSAFRRGMEDLTGYETMHTGEQIPL